MDYSLLFAIEKINNEEVNVDSEIRSVVTNSMSMRRPTNPSRRGTKAKKDQRVDYVEAYTE